MSAAGTEPTAPDTAAAETPPEARGTLGMWDAVSIIVGIVVGTSIYKVTGNIAFFGGSVGMTLLWWLMGGVLSFLGALVYAELATTYPRDGGDYVYLTRAFGKEFGFLFGWAQLAVILTSSIAMMAIVFAEYSWVFVAPVGKDVIAEDVAAKKADWLWQAAIGAVGVFTLLNIIGVVLGKVVQNVLTVVKILSLLAIFGVGVMYFDSSAFSGDKVWPESASKVNWDMSAVALILVLYAFGGWNDAAFVAAEVRDVKRNLTRALFWGIGIITVLYMLVNVAYFAVLGYDGAAGFGKNVPADVLAKAFGEGGAKVMSAMVLLSALGAVNGLIFAGSRVYSTLGKDHSLFAFMGGWSKTSKTPVTALLVQGVVAGGMIWLAGSAQGHDALRSAIGFFGLDSKIEWKPEDAFDFLFACSAPVFWSFFLLTGLSLFVLRQLDPNIERPFRVPFYPVVPLLFCGSCALWIFRSLNYALTKGVAGVLILGLGPIVVGVPLYLLSRGLDRARGKTN